MKKTERISEPKLRLEIAEKGVLVTLRAEPNGREQYRTSHEMRIAVGIGEVMAINVDGELHVIRGNSAENEKRN